MRFILCKQGSFYPGIVDYNLNVLHRVANLQASAGMIIFPEKVGAARGAIFVDGRYTLAADLAVDKSKFDIEKFSFENFIRWIKTHLSPNDIISIDPKYFTRAEVNFLHNSLTKFPFNYIDLYEHFQLEHQVKNLELYTLENSKIERCAAWIKSINLDAYLFADPCFVSWLLGMRDLSNKCSCAILGYLLVQANGISTLYLDDEYSQGRSRNVLYAKHMRHLRDDLKQFRKVGANFCEISAEIDALNVADVECPIDQTIKTRTEIEDIKCAAKNDSIALIKFLHWFHTSNEKISELDAVEKIEEFRKQNSEYICNSFETIAAADEHAAIVHYEPTENSNAEVKNILLLDSGGQYKNGTTDITRTISRTMPTEYERTVYTQVLKGHIALATIKFPIGTTGAQLDVLARQYLWNDGRDFHHGTGHGIGYLLNVHEGHVAISRGCNLPLKADMLLSNEPGYYEENRFGVRLENMMLVKKLDEEFLHFEVVSLVPFDRKFIDEKLLTDNEKNWLENYNAKILGMCHGIDENIFQWLKEYLREHH